MRTAAVIAVALLLSSTFLSAVPKVAAQGEPAFLVVGDRDQMRSRNVLRVPLGPVTGEDVGVGIFQAVYSTPVLTGPVADEVRPYIAKGVDADEDGVFEPSEYGAFLKNPGTNSTDVVAYLDFNGVRWHDGVQLTPMDLYFSLAMASLNPRSNPDFRVLWDRGGGPGSNFTWTRWIAVSAVRKAWIGEGSIPGDSSLRVALQFRLQKPYPMFYERTLGNLWLLPRHVWEDNGGGRHPDFGRAVYPEGDPRAGQGMPVNETSYKPFDFAAAETWEPIDADVVGSGPFRFGTWAFGQLTRLDRNDAYFVGTDPADARIVYDARLAGSIHRPYVGGFEFRIYRTMQLGVLALLYGDIDYLRATIPPEFVPDILISPIRVWAYPDAGFTYFAYNMRRPWLGYNGTPPDAVDSGRAFRMAAAHLLDKQSYVVNLLQNYGVVACSVVSPANTRYYNESVSCPRYDVTAARAILDNAGFVDTNGNGWRELPMRGDAGLEILTTQVDYELIRPAVGTMWTNAMQAVGLNVTLRPTPFGVLVNRVETHDFDLYILGWRVSGADPDYLFSLFHCSGADSGLDYAGYCNPALDRALEESRTTMDLPARVRLIRLAQGIIMEDRPVEPVFYRTTIQATRQDKFVNWTQTFGGVWNYWSWIGVRPVTELRDLWLAVSAPSAVASGAKAPITATVRDTSGDPLAGATVSLEVVATDGGRFVESGGANVTGRTNAGGTFSVTYEAPTLAENTRDILIQTTANHDLARAPAQRTVAITVFATGLNLLGLRASFPTGDLTTPDAPVPIRVDVLDATGAPVPDALVEATVWPRNGTLSRTHGTAVEMATILFSPPPSLATNLDYGIEVTAEKVGYFPARTNVSVFVVVLEGGRPPTPPEGYSSDLLLVFAVASSLMAATGLAVVAWVWRLRKASRPRR